MTDIKIDVAALAKLVRLEVSDEEIMKLEKEIPDIVKFVEAIQSADVSHVHESKELRNVMRADEAPHAGGIYTDVLLKAAPARNGNRIAVKQVITRKK